MPRTNLEEIKLTKAKNADPCYSRYGAIKIPSRSKVILQTLISSDGMYARM